MSRRGYPTRSFRTSKRPSRIMKQARIGTVWQHKETGKLHTIVNIRPAYHYSCYIQLDTEAGWLLPPRYFWDLFRKYEDISGQV